MHPYGSALCPVPSASPLLWTAEDPLRNVDSSFRSYFDAFRAHSTEDDPRLGKPLAIWKDFHWIAKG